MNRKIGTITGLILVLVIIVITIILADLGQLPLGFLKAIPDYDLWGHLILYGLLAFTLRKVISRDWGPKGNIRLPISGLITFALILAEEISQLFFDTRTFDLADIMAGVLGLFLGTDIALWNLKKPKVKDAEGDQQLAKIRVKN